MNGADVQYKLSLEPDGTARLEQGEEPMWTSTEGDFIGEWGDSEVTGDELEEVAEWLVGAGYLPPGCEVHFIDDTGDEWFSRVYPATEDDTDDFDESDDDDDDDDELSEEVNP